MTDPLADICDYLDLLTGIHVYRGQLPKSFDNTAPCVVVSLQDDAHSVSSSTRRVIFQFRIYGGSASATVCGEWYNSVLEHLTGASYGRILHIGELSGQELPGDPVTGWPAYLLRATARINER